MRCVVTGSSGHLGAALVRALEQRGDAVSGLDLQPSPFTTVVGSVANPHVVRDVLADADIVFHTATLHQPQLVTHTRQAFVDTNVSGTLTLLDAAVGAGVGAVVFTSTTSVFGATPSSRAAPAVWVTEDTIPRPQTIYGVTKLAAEHLVEEAHIRHRLPVAILRASRFFPVQQDAGQRGLITDENLEVNELLHRRIGLDDLVRAHLSAARRAPDLGFGRYITSATTPFRPAHLHALRTTPAAIVADLFPDQPTLYAERGWSLPTTIDRVYVNTRAVEQLRWTPRHDFGHALAALRARSWSGENRRTWTY